MGVIRPLVLLHDLLCRGRRRGQRFGGLHLCRLLQRMPNAQMPSNRALLHQKSRVPQWRLPAEEHRGREAAIRGLLNSLAAPLHFLLWKTLPALKCTGEQRDGCSDPHLSAPVPFGDPKTSPSGRSPSQHPGSNCGSIPAQGICTGRSSTVHFDELC